MRRIVLLFIVCSIGLDGSLRAQSTQVALDARLLNKTLFLRGLWKNDKLHFDPTGQLRGRSDITNPMRSGIFVNSVKLDASHLLVKGDRVVVYREDGKLKAEPIGEGIELQFDTPSGGDYTSSLEAAITDQMAALTVATPTNWLPCLSQALNPVELPAQPNIKDKDLTPPKILFFPTPLMPKEVQAKHFDVKVLVSITLDSCGNLTRIKLVSSSDAAFNASAMDCARQYRFAPALFKNRPIAFAMQLEVAFTRI